MPNGFVTETNKDIELIALVFVAYDYIIRYGVGLYQMPLIACFYIVLVFWWFFFIIFVFAMFTVINNNDRYFFTSY